MIRKLASVQKIIKIEDIPGAEFVEVATVNAWKVVVKKGEFSVGDLVIYFEVDSFIPTALAPFLTKGDSEPREYNGVKGERLRTVKLRGITSQGLVLPMSEYDYKLKDASADDQFYSARITPFIEGEDVSEHLCVLKYEPPIPACLAGVVKGPWPSAIPKTDEERVQNLTNEWPELLKVRYEISEKMEGASMTVGLVNNEFIVCSRNLNLTETESNTLWNLARRYDIENKMRALACYEVAIQGECIGEGIEGNHYGIKGQDFYVYSIYDIVAGKYLSPEKRVNICNIIGLKHVPIVAYTADLYDTLGISTIDQVLKYSDGKSNINPTKLREGLVYKQVDGQVHWKAVSNSYLLKHGSR